MVNEMLEDTMVAVEHYYNGQPLFEDRHFADHIWHQVPVQVYLDREHREIGFIERFCDQYVQIEGTLFPRTRFTFLSRPGY